MPDRLPRPRTRAEAHFARTGCILPGHQGEIAGYIARNSGGSDAD